MTLIVDGTTGVTFNDSSLQGAAASPNVLKNRIINGDMRIDQRNAGASLTPANQYTLDRWTIFNSQASKLTVQQNAASVTPPAGFSNYLGVTSSSAYTVLAGDYFILSQMIEGYNMADLDWGTANAKTVTLSFWVRSSLTGNFGASVRNSAGNRSYPVSYTISSANTWEYKTITITGDITGTWQKTNSTGIELSFSLGIGSTYSGTANTWSSSNFVQPTGSTSVVGTNGATWYVTGVQLEQNTSATPFERRLYGQELANCQRYYYVALNGTNSWVGGAGYAFSVSQWNCPILFPVTMRATPSLVNNSGSIYYGLDYSGSRYINSLSIFQPNNQVALIYGTPTSNFASAGYAMGIFGNNGSALIAFSAEL
jgi:hypothetical protein